MWRLAASAVVAVSLAACGGLTPLTRSGPYADVPWSQRPVPPDPALAHEAYQVCVVDAAMLTPRRDRPELTPAVQDQRGPNAGVFLWVDDTGEATCTVVRESDGRLRMVSGAATEGPQRLSGRLQLSGIADTPPLTLVGESGPAARVVIDLADGASFDASLAGGRFAAWWPSMTPAVRVRTFDVAGNLVETLQVPAYQPHQ